MNIRLTTAVACLAALVFIVHYFTNVQVSSRPQFEMALSTVQDLEISETYRASAGRHRHASPVRYVAGKGFPDRSDGPGLAAGFSHPVGMCLSPSGEYLYVLDDKGHRLRRVDVYGEQVETLYTVAKDALPLVKVVRTQQAFYFVDAGGGLQEYVGQGPARFLPLPSLQGKLVRAADIAVDDGRLYVLALSPNVVITPRPNFSAWDIVLSHPDVQDRDTLFAAGGQVFLISSKDTLLLKVDTTGKPAAFSRLEVPEIPRGVILDRDSARFLVYSDSRFYSLPLQEPSEPTELPFHNMHGKVLDQGPAASMAAVVDNPLTGLLYILDPENHRVLSMPKDFGSKNYDDQQSQTLNAEKMLAPDYSLGAPNGTNRIIWAGHSVFFDPSGEHKGNIEFGAPRVLERLLNERSHATWELINVHSWGVNFIDVAHRRIETALSLYGAQHVILAVDLQTFFWIISTLNKARTTYENGVVTGIDYTVSGLNLDLQPASFGRLTSYIRQHPDLFPLKNKEMMREGSFPKIWETDSEFREALFDIIRPNLKYIKELSDRAGARLTVFLIPTANFMASREWAEAFGHESETRYDFEKMHTPLLNMLKSLGINVYDLSYELMSLHMRYFPFGRETHKSYLFHEALARALYDVLAINGAASTIPIEAPARLVDSQENDTRRVHVPEWIAFTEQGNRLVVMHDLENEEDAPLVAGRPVREVEVLLAQEAIQDARLLQKAVAHVWESYQVVFFQGTERNEYSERLFSKSNMRSVVEFSKDVPERLGDTNLESVPDGVAVRFLD